MPTNLYEFFQSNDAIFQPFQFFFIISNIILLFPIIAISISVTSHKAQTYLLDLNASQFLKSVSVQTFTI